MSPALWFSHFESDPWFNMGFDEWMLGSALSVPGLLIVRLYTWSEGTITFGRNQRQDSALKWDGVGWTPVIRRVTGGRAVYHDPGEFTYSLALNPRASDRRYLGGSVARSSALISEALLHFVQQQGMTSEIVARSGQSDAHPEVFHKAPCFASAARHELMAGDRKVVASAQRQVDGVILQHGSIKLHGLAWHPALPAAGVSGQTDVVRRVESDQWNRVAASFQSVMGSWLGAELIPSALDAKAEREVDMLAQRVRSNPLERRPPVKQTALANSL